MDNWILGGVDLSLTDQDCSWVKTVAAAGGSRVIRSASGACALSGAEQLPGAPHLTIAADSRLHCRPDLCRTLGIRLPSRNPYPDALLLLAAFEKWGRECANFLLGEFAFAIWDDRSRRLFCCRDHLGSRPLYYLRQGSRFVFASDEQFILSLPGVPRELNRRKLAAMSIALGQHRYGEETFFAGIESLAGGASLVADGDGTRVTTYWEPKLPSESPVRDEGQMFEALRELLTQSVENRMSGSDSVAALLSGGLDSSSIVSIAARCLQKSNRTLTAISSVLPEENPTQFTDEREYMEEFRPYPNVRIEYVTAAGRGPFDKLRDPDYFRGSFTYSSRYSLYDSIHEIAEKRGSQIILDGIGGELGPTFWGDGYYLELATGLRWPTLARELRALRGTRGISPLRMMGSLLLRPLLPARRNLPIVMLNPLFARDRAVKRSDLRYWTNHREYQLDLLKTWQQRHASGRGQMTLGSIRFSYPFLDKRILEFCLAAPGNMKVRDGYQRYLIRRALDGMLPKKIQWRTSKCPGCPDYYVRYNRQLGVARDFVAGIGARDPVRSVVDVDRLAASLFTVDPKQRSRLALTVVPATLYLICFLRQFADFRR